MKTSLIFEEIVVRRDGGRLDNFVKIVKQEHFTVGEKVMLFQLYQPEQMTQVPDGFEIEQYYMFASGSKFVRKKNGIYYSEDNRRVSEKEVYDIIKNSKKMINRG
ncbi:hypothetical protein [Sporosarcina koreensis]|uniref:Uncharacterized protein n=1 Tax=Sporosarcina koreensis TaxID=334735 RepID=A0ABW0U141_9BACL